MNKFCVALARQNDVENIICPINEKMSKNHCLDEIIKSFTITNPILYALVA